MAEDKGNPGTDPEVSAVETPGEADPGYTPTPDQDLPGEELAREDLADPEPFAIDPSEDEAEELTDAPTAEPAGAQADDEVEIDDATQLEEAESEAVGATSTRPVRKAAAPARPVRKVEAKTTATPSRKKATESTDVAKRTSPAEFVRQSVAELKKVVWPTGNQLRQYFTVVLAFVLFMIAVVSLLDAGFGWAMLKVLG